MPYVGVATINQASNEFLCVLIFELGWFAATYKQYCSHISMFSLITSCLSWDEFHELQFQFWIPTSLQSKVTVLEALSTGAMTYSLGYVQEKVSQ